MIQATRSRVESIDVLRGLVIVLMAIDHVRDMWSLYPFAPEDLTQTTPGYFFTRWITHFCAPVFVFLAGTSIYLYLQKIRDRKALSVFLLTRGLWLIAIEIILVNWSWSWTLPFWSWGFFLQVIWALGVSMIAMSLLIWLSTSMVLVVSLLMIAGHNLFNFVVPGDWGSFAWLWRFLHEGGWVPLNNAGSYGIFVAYPVIPWIGVMGAGFALGQIMSWDAKRRIRALWILGLVATVLFVVLRYFNLYGDTGEWAQQDSGLFTFMSFLNTQKYPPSLLFLLMTLGPAFFLLILFERWKSPLSDILRTYGRVPFFFYVLHFPVIHATSMLYFKLAHGEWFDLANSQQRQNWPDFYQPSLLRLYLAWLVIVVVFYFLCRWYDHYKSSHRHWWLKYL